MEAQAPVRERATPVVRVASQISGWGSSVPERVVPNDYFATYLETSDEWITDRTGIKERRWCGPNETMWGLALPACERAIAKAGLTAKQIDGIIVATVTPDYTFPSTACILQSKLGMGTAFAFDMNAVCSGFVFAVSTANALIASGQARNLLVVGCDMYSRILDPNDRGTVVIFGDGAGAIVLSAAGEGPGVDGSGVDGFGAERGLSGSARSLRGIYAAELHSEGSQPDLLRAGCGVVGVPKPEDLARSYVSMNGREVFKHAVRGLSSVSESVLRGVGLTKDDLDWVFTHQANKRIIDAVSKGLGLPVEKVPMNLQRYGNTSAASVPLILSECADDGRLKQGDLCMLSAFGGGLTWGAVLVRF